MLKQAMPQVPGASCHGIMCRVQGEGPSIFKPTAQDYYMVASHLTYWNPNPPMLFHASGGSLRNAAWHNLTMLARGEGANTTYNSQSSFVFPLEFADGTTLYIYMGDRWNFAGPGSVRCQACARVPFTSVTLPSQHSYVTAASAPWVRKWREESHIMDTKLIGLLVN